MIARLFSSLTSLTDQVKTIHQTAYILAFFSLVSIVLALMRDRMFAHMFGAGSTLDIYNAAFRIPDVLFIVISSLVSVFVVIPALTAAREDGRDHALSRTLALAAGVLYTIVGIAAFFTLPFTTQTLFPELYARGYGDELLTISYILLLQPLILGISNLAASCVQMYGRFTLFALAPVLYNLGIIFGAVVLYPHLGLSGLAWGVVLGACLHMAIQLPFFFVHGLAKRTPHTPYFVRMRDVFGIMSLSVPRTLSLATTSLAFLVVVAYASTLATGSITLFTFAFNLAAAPLSLIGASYSVAAFPTLSRLYKENNYAEFTSHMLTAGRHILFWSLPLTALCIVLRAHIVRAILGTGMFSWSDTRIAAAAFALFILSLAAQGITLLFIRGYYAAERTVVPLVVSMVTGALSIVFAIGLSSLYTREGMFYYFLHDLLRLAPLDDASVALLALGMSLASIIGATLIVCIFSFTFRGVGSEMAQALRDGFVGAVFAGTGAYLALLGFKQVYGLSSFVEIVTQGFVAGLAGCLLAGIVLYLIGNREVREVYAALHGSAMRLSRLRPKGVETHSE